jgi:hypothetical protein
MLQITNILLKTTLMNWTELLYNESKQLWINSGKNPKGYAIFYSPVRKNPKLS